MRLTKLYIIGNGFDLWHGIPSRFSDFKEYVNESDSTLSRIIDRYLSVRTDWRDLESSLGEFDVDYVVEDLGHFMTSYGAEDWSDSGHHAFQQEIDRVAENLSERLQEHLCKWVRTLEIPTSRTALKRLNLFDINSAFLTFNYTTTLRDLYAVPEENVLHIHGQSNDEECNLILGHAWNPDSRQSLNDRSDIDEIDTRLFEANTILDEYFSKTFKPSEELIRTYKHFFDQLGSIEVVYVIGHSLSDVDLIYFNALMRLPNIQSALWYVSCENEFELRARADRLVELGVNPQRTIPFVL